MTTLFIADLHLQENRPDIAELFFRFLREHAAEAKALYILGDLFEAWIGDDDDSDFNRSVIQALRRTHDKGVVLHFMPGNRDFLISKKFCKETGCHLLPDEHLIQIGDQRMLLMHGDTLCTRDLKYLKFRKRSRGFLMQTLFLLRSLEKRRAMVQKGRERSREHTATTAMEIMDVTQEEVERVMRKHQVSELIHGHTHRPAEHHFLLDNRKVRRTVLAPWHERGFALVCRENGERESIEIK